LSSWLDVGEWHEEDYAGPDVSNLRQWTTLFRRVHVPYYEEARNYTEELRDERSGGANEIYLYLPETLRRIIEEHEQSQSYNRFGALRPGAFSAPIASLLRCAYIVSVFRSGNTEPEKPRICLR
jgi:hypothetical protein